MQTTEDPGREGVAGQNSANPEREASLLRVQDSAGHAVPHPAAPNDKFEEDALPGLRSEIERAISSNYVNDAFAATVWNPRPYQVRGVDWLLRPEAALFLPPGLGKSSMGLMAILMLRKMGYNHRTLLL